MNDFRNIGMQQAINPMAQRINPLAQATQRPFQQGTRSDDVINKIKQQYQPNKMQILGATLQDIGAALDRRQGGALASIAEQRGRFEKVMQTALESATKTERLMEATEAYKAGEGEEWLSQRVEEGDPHAFDAYKGALDLAIKEQRANQERLPSLKEQALNQLGGMDALTREQQEKLAGVHIAEKADKLDYMLKLPPESPEKTWFRRRYNDDTFTVMGNVKTKQDLEELVQNREAYESQGVNVREIIRYFTEK
jgi:hypothetical protein